MNSPTDPRRFLYRADALDPDLAQKLAREIAISAPLAVQGTRDTLRKGLVESVRLAVAREQGCTVGMMVAQAGSGSQRNAERNGFRIAYTRYKWRLPLRS